MVELNNNTGVINTFSGVEFDLFNPKPHMVKIEDIARALAYNPHFNGHTPAFFSIAEHCMLVADLVPNYLGKRGKLVALLHDAAEAYVGDLISPLKNKMPFFRHTENKIIKAVFEHFNLPIHLMGTIKKYDEKAKQYEFDAFYGDGKFVTYHSPDKAEVAFLRRFAQYTKL
jgi:5'-deoxynucleotidase YfbR-like HD superfamily hydrolase